MTDAPPKKRPWFQLHLSTCVVLMVVAGALVWGNLYTYTFRGVEVFPGKGEVEVFARGWPAQHWVCLKNDPANGEYLIQGVALNAAIALAFLAAFAFSWEIFLRRREQKRAAGVPGPDMAHPE